MLLTEFVRLIQHTFPPSTAMQGDPIGVHVDSIRGTATNVLLTLELTDEVLEEAVQHACDCIVAFHPLVYRPLARIDRSDRVGRLVANAIRHDIAIIVVHTAFDAFPQGTNALLASRLDLHVDRILVPHALDGYGMGLVARSAAPLSFEELVHRVADVCGSPVRFLPSPSPLVHTVAIVAGSGMSFLPDTLAAGVDVFLTADAKYHDFHAAHGRIGIIDPGHYEMEQFVAEGMRNALEAHVPSTVHLQCSRCRTNPVQYFHTLPVDSISHH